MQTFSFMKNSIISTQIIILTVTLITLLATMSNIQSPLFAMTTMPKYKFIHAFQSTRAKDMTVFIKKLSNDWLIVCDRKNFGDVLDINNNYQSIYKFNSHSPDQYWFHDIFNYTDTNGNNLLVAYNNKMNFKVMNINESFVLRKSLYVGYKHSLHQKLDGTLVLVNHENSMATDIFPTWENAKHQLENKKTILFRQENTLPSKEVYVRDEGIIIHYMKIVDHPSLELSSDQFDLTSVPTEFNQLIFYIGSERLKKIYCYHQTLDDFLYCGHDYGVVSLWKILR